MKIGVRTPLPKFERSTVGNWKSGGFIKCTHVNSENADVNSYRFKDPDDAGFKFKPGQHISIRLPLNSGDEYRTFTICSSPTRVNEITLTVKTNRPDGATAWMRDNIGVGSLFSAVGPTGFFNLVDNPCETLLLISAGSGITPMMSMLRWLWERRDNLDITFIHYAKNSDEYLFSNELAQINDSYSSLRYHQISTHRQDDEIYGLPTTKQILSLVDIQDQQVFCCGPTGFMDLVKSILIQNGLPSEKYHQESFGSDLIDAPTTPVDQSADNVIVTFKNKEFEAKPGEKLLSVLKKNQVVIPTGCKLGMCGTCQMKLISGTVDMNHLGGLSDQQIEENIILACCSTLTENISVL